MNMRKLYLFVLALLYYLSTYYVNTERNGSGSNYASKTTKYSTAAVQGNSATLSTPANEKGTEETATIVTGKGEPYLGSETNESITEERARKPELHSEYSSTTMYEISKYTTYASSYLITEDDVEMLLRQNTTQSFLLQFNSTYQRDVLYKQLRYCPYTSLCRFSLSLTFFSTLQVPCCAECSCDFPDCLHRKICCPDLVFDYTNKHGLFYDYENFPVELRFQKDCIPLSLSKDFDMSSKSAVGYSYCPVLVNTQLSNNCSRQYNSFYDLLLTDTIPVIDTYTGELYKNKYCAMCHGIPESQIQLLQIRLYCLNRQPDANHEDILGAIFAEDKCFIHFFSEMTLESCTTGKATCLNDSDTFVTAACDMYHQVFYDYKFPYQNVFCGLCNGITPLFGCPMPVVKETSRSFSFSGVLKLDEVDTIGYRLRLSGRCSDKQLYDSITGTCKQLICPEFSVLKNGTCKMLYKAVDKTIYAAYLRLKPSKQMSITDAYNIVDDIIEYMTTYVNNGSACGIQILYRTNLTDQDIDLFDILDYGFRRFEISVQYSITWTHEPLYVVNAVLGMHDIEKVFHSKASNETFALIFEVRDDDPDKFFMISDIARSSAIFDVKHMGKSVSLNLSTLLNDYTALDDDNFVTFPHLRYRDNSVSCGSKGTNFLHQTICPKIEIFKSDIYWEETEYGLLFLESNFVLQGIDYYIIDEDRIMVCSNVYKQYLLNSSNLNSEIILSTETILSIVCSVISILALCFTLIVFCLLPHLRQTLPGKNNMSLIVSLLSAQLLYLIGSLSRFKTKSMVCTGLGILIHFTLLVALFWMNVCTFHMFRIFNRTQALSYSSGINQLIRYHIYALAMSALFVSINIVTSYMMYGNIGYGLSTCYISSQKMIIYTFGIPAAGIISCNLSLFFVVVCKIKGTGKVQKNVQNRRNDIAIFAKLSTITGATWVFGVLYSVTNLNVMSYLFILLNASQGVFIMVAFVANKRVMDLLKGQHFDTETKRTTVPSKT